MKKAPIVRAGVVTLLAWLGAGCSGGALDAGASPPEFTVVSPVDSTEVSSASLSGKPVLIDFWATWCGPCKQALPHIQELWRNYKDKGLQVIAVSTEDSQTVAAFQNDQHLELPIYLDPGNKMSQAFGVSGLPTTLIIGKNGKVVYSVMGTSSDVEAELDKAVAEAVQ